MITSILQCFVINTNPKNVKKVTIVSMSVHAENQKYVNTKLILPTVARF